MSQNKPLKHRIINNAAAQDFKQQAYVKILHLRLDPEAQGDEAALAKKKKFLNFIMNLQVRAGLRKWKESVFGLKGDPRLKLLIIEERDRIRNEYYEPRKEARVNIKEMAKARVAHNREMARAQKQDFLERLATVRM